MRAHLIAIIGVGALTVCAGAAEQPYFLPGVDVAYAVTQNNELYSYNLNTHTLTYKQVITGLQPGESIRGIDMKDYFFPDTGPSLDAYMLGSSGRVYCLDYNQGTGSWNTSMIMPTWGFAVTGDSVGFEVKQLIDGSGISASSSNGPLYAHKPSGYYTGVTSMAHYANGSPAHIGGLASWIDSAYYAPPWGLLGIDVGNAKLVNVDPHHPPNGYGGPTLGLVTPLFDVTGEAGALELSGLVGFDMQLRHANPGEPAGGLYSLLALNETGNSYTSIYARVNFQNPMVFVKVGDMILDSRTPIRFTAVAMTPSPGAMTLFCGAAAIGLLRQRRVT